MSENHKRWTIRVPDDFHKERMSDKSQAMLLVLEGLARSHVVCFPSNDTLCERTGKSERAVQTILSELETPTGGGAPWIKRVFTNGKKPERIGIVMLRRINSELPAASLSGSLTAAVAMIKDCGELDVEQAKACTRMVVGIEASERRNLRAEHEENCALSTQKTAPEEVYPELRGFEKETAPTSSARNNVIANVASDASEPQSSPDREDDSPRQFASLLEALTRKPQTKVAQRKAVDKIACFLARLFLDDHSIGNYRKHCWRVARGEVDAEMLAKAFSATYDKVAENGVGVLGSYFFGALANLEADEAHEEVELDIREGRGAEHGARPAETNEPHFDVNEELRQQNLDADYVRREAMQTTLQCLEQDDSIEEIIQWIYWGGEAVRDLSGFVGKERTWHDEQTRIGFEWALKTKGVNRETPAWPSEEPAA
jgi:hypothetical protein